MAETDNETWIDIKDACVKLGMTYETAKNKIAADDFPVPTYKLGRRRVVDKDVLAAFFSDRRKEGLEKLAAIPVKDGRRKTRQPPDEK